jgi:3',5'-cyclic AMP phosphodiesterase CpdA
VVRTLRLAHFSDIHYTLSPTAGWPLSARGKRLVASFGYYLRGLGARFKDNPARIAKLLEDVDLAQVDHAICTGDLCSTTLDEELEGLAQLFGPRLTAPERFTVIPGNHDRYVEDAVQRRTFEAALGRLLPGPTFPAEKILPGGVRLVVLDPCRPTPAGDASGAVGPAQLAAAEALLAADPNTPTIVALHYGLLRYDGRYDRPLHGLIDAPQLIELLDRSPARIILVLHGHMHRAFTVATAKRTIVCAGSAIDLRTDAGYFIYEIDLETLAVRAERRAWSRLHQRYERADTEVITRAILERRGVLV